MRIQTPDVVGLKLPIGPRLFLAMLATLTFFSAVWLELARWRLLDNFSHERSNVTSKIPQSLVEDVAEHYRQANGWSFLSTDSPRDKTWLRDESVELVQAGHLDGDSIMIGYRLGLVNTNNHRLAGVVANRFVRTFASLDTLRSPVVVNHTVVGYLTLSNPRHAVDEVAVAFLMDQQENLVLVATAAMLLSVLAAALLAANFRKPIRDLVAGTRLLADSRFDTRVPAGRRDEFGELAATFNRLAERLGDNDRSHQRWVADTSHELRTPLAVLRGQLEALQDGIRPPSADNIKLMMQEVSSLTKLVKDLDLLTSADHGMLRYSMEDVDVWQLVCETVMAFLHRFQEASLTANIGESPAKVIVSCDRDRIHQVITNLLENCVRYTSAGGRVEVSGTVAGDDLHIDIDDSAPGVPQASRQRLGERFFRVEASRNRQLGGTGLGLALSRQILEAHGGRLEFDASPTGGLRAHIVLRLGDLHG